MKNGAYFFCNVQKWRLVESVGIVAKLHSFCTQKSFKLSNYIRCLKPFSYVTCPTSQRQQRLILDALCSCHHLILFFFCPSNFDDTYRKQTHHELIWDDVQSQTAVSSGLKKRRGVSIKGLLRALFSFGRHCSRSCNLCLAASLTWVLPFLSLCVISL